MSDKTSKFTFWVDKDIWAIKISEEGIKFNREVFPMKTPNDFAKIFIEILEKNYKVKFTKDDKSIMEWISCNDSLPKEGSRVLIGNDEEIEMGYYFKDGWKIYEGGFWDSVNNNTHWMPLPQPPNKLINNIDNKYTF